MSNNNKRTNSEIKSEIIDIENFEEDSLKEMDEIQIKSIAKSVGVSLVKNKQEEIDKITRVLKKHKENIEKFKHVQSFNPFNGNKIELLIKEGLEETELLFWRIFRNKVLFKRIFSGFDLSISYDSIISVTSMIRNNQLFIIKDKVKRNQYLVDFNTYPNKDIEKLFNSELLKNDREFYQLFFKQYLEFCFDFNQDKNQLIKSIIKSRNLVPLEILYQESLVIPHIDHLKLSLEEGATKFIDYLISFKDINSKKLIVESLSNINTVKSFKSINYLVNVIKIVSIQDLKKGSFDYKSLFKIPVFKSNFKLKDIIVSCKLLDNFENTEIITQETPKFSKQQLNSLLNNQINSYSKEKETIKYLLLKYYSVNKLNELEFHLAYGILDNEDIELFDREEITIQLPIDYGHFSLFIKALSVNRTKNPFIRLTYFELFSKIGNDECIKKKFVLEYLNYSKLIRMAFKTYYLREHSFLELLIIYDNLDLIKLYIQEFEKDTELWKMVSLCRFSSIINKIKSKQVLQYICKRFYTLWIGPNDWYNIEDLSNLNYYLEFITENNDCPNVLTKLIDQKHPISIKKLRFILDNPDIFQFEYNIQFRIINSVEEKGEDKYTNITILKRIILEDPYIRLIFDNEFIKNNNTQFLNWLFKFGKDDNRFKIEDEAYYNYRIGIYNNKLSNLIATHIGETGNLNILGIYLNLFYTNPSDYEFNDKREFINSILQSAARNGQICIFEYINLHHNYILIKCNKNQGYFILKELREFVKISMLKKHLKLVGFLLDIIRVTENQFKSLNAGHNIWDQAKLDEEDIIKDVFVTLFKSRFNCSYVKNNNGKKNTKKKSKK